MNARQSTSPSLALRLLAAFPLVLPGAEIPFEELGQAFIENNCPDADGPKDCGFEELIGARFASVRLGAFELAFPLEYLGGKRRMEAQLIALTALDFQAEWMKSFALEPATAQAAASEIEVLRTWVDGWSKSELGSLAKGAGGDMLVLFEADDAVRKASENFGAMPLAADKMILAPQYTKFIRLLFAPTRREFMELVGYTGLALPERREDLWHDGVDQWTQFWIDQTVVVALEYAPWSPDPKYKTGLSMTKFDKDGLRQHFVQQAAGSLLFRSLNRVDMTLFEKGLAVNFTIAICGKANTIDGEGAISSTGASTAPYERFVPGGNPNGGFLPAIPAAGFDSIVGSHWREGGGTDLYAKALRAGQKAGAKKAKKDRQNPLNDSDVAHFELRSDSGKKHVVTAPFLGRLATQKSYPDADYMNDFREFYRSYQACFLSWLKANGVPGDAEASAAKYHELLAKVAAPGGASLDDAAAAVYGVPLSSSEGGDSIEWRFLSWLRN